MGKRLLDFILQITALFPAVGVSLVLNGKIEPQIAVFLGGGICALGLLAGIYNWQKIDGTPVILKVIYTAILLNMEAAVAVFVAKNQIVSAFGELGATIIATYIVAVGIGAPLHLVIIVKYWRK